MENRNKLALEKVKEIHQLRYRRQQFDELNELFREYKDIFSGLLLLFSIEKLPNYTLEKLKIAIDAGFIDVLSKLSDDLKNIKEPCLSLLSKIEEKINKLNQFQYGSDAAGVKNFEILISNVILKLDQFPYGEGDTARYSYYIELLADIHILKSLIRDIDKYILKIIGPASSENVHEHDPVKIEVNLTIRTVILDGTREHSHPTVPIEEVKQGNKIKSKNRVQLYKQKDLTKHVHHKETGLKNTYSWGLNFLSIFTAEKKIEPSVNYFELIPYEVFIYILLFISPREIVNLELVNSGFRVAASDDILWKRKFKHYYPDDYPQYDGKYKHENVVSGFWRRNFFIKYKPVRIMKPILKYSRHTSLMKLYDAMMSGNANLVEKFLLDSSLIYALTEMEVARIKNSVFINMPCLYYFLCFCKNQNVLDVFYKNKNRFYKRKDFSYFRNKEFLFDDWVWMILCKQPFDANDLSIFSGKIDSYGFAAVHYAFAANYLDLILAFYRKNFDFDVKLNWGSYRQAPCTPLMLAVANDHVCIINLIVKGEIAIKDASGKFVPPFSDVNAHIAVENGNKDIIKIMLKYDYRRKEKIIELINYTIKRGNFIMLKFVLDWYPENILLNLLNSQKMNPLVKACDDWHPSSIDMIQYLLSKGANPNFLILTPKAPPGYTPFSVAVNNIDKSTIKLLLLHGADPHMMIGYSDDAGKIYQNTILGYTKERHEEVYDYMVNILENLELDKKINSCLKK